MNIIIKEQGGKYFLSVGDRERGLIVQGQRAGLTPDQAAATAAEAMLRYGPIHGAALLAPQEVRDLVPSELHHIDAK